MDGFEYWSPEGLIKSGKYGLTLGQLRHLLLHRHKNQLDKVVRKVGKRLYLRKDLWADWFESQLGK